MTTRVLRHEPTDECNGEPITMMVGVFSDRPKLKTAKCRECSAPLCSCERAYGHDCE